MTQPPLVEAYMNGYHAHFEEHYSDREGYHAGFLFGLKCDPSIQPLLSKQALYAILDGRRSIILDKYPLNEIQLIIFTQGFIKGYESGYLQTKEGITARRGEPFNLIDP